MIRSEVLGHDDRTQMLMSLALDNPVLDCGELLRLTKSEVNLAPHESVVAKLRDMALFAGT